MDTEMPVPEHRTKAHRRPRTRRALAIVAGAAMVPALYAVAAAATGGGNSPTPTATAGSTHDRGVETEVEHGVEVEKPHGGAATPSVPEATTAPSTPEATAPTLPEQEVEHPVPEPGDDRGADDDHGDGSDASSQPATTQSFSSVGGSIVVSAEGNSLSLVSSSPAPGYAAEAHDNSPGRVEVRFANASTEWRIRVELGIGGLTSEITQHG